MTKQWLRFHFAANVPAMNGDNCMLTRDFAFIDLSFSRLLA